ncbi:hypothetical protein Goshw_004493 [Gossypium schwendimanii]|uniref:DUF7950 domain-containing protein n=1 Tax=Gossypium schwendimanii TaxID=34291 RepID=A0A7J9LE66_GOSSC|nr:hypothetical protein [Gossypium schwendimanii]
MEGGDQWRMLKCAGGVQDKTIINRIMLRFRPIAPKPVTGESASGESTFGNKNSGVTSMRVKRKYVRVCEKNNRRRRALDEAKDDKGGNKGSVTLQLMPERADLEKSAVVDSSGADQEVAAAVMGLSDQATGRKVSFVESWVTVESITDSCMDEGDLGSCTDVDRMSNLDKDTYPGFISDGWHRVLWVNEAYKSMVGGEGAETAVGLVVKEGFKFPQGAFSCRVGLRYGDGKGKKKQSKMVPCDVWKMSFGGFAWRLDVKAALGLGL